jgi:hypothetical protein
MKVVVQQMEKKLFLQNEEQWTPARTEALEFETALEAISFCIATHRRAVRLLGQREDGTDVYLYPFGGDPVARAERKKVRKAVAESHRLKCGRRMIRAQIDVLAAGQKEKGKKLPFKRSPVAGEGQATG